MYIIRVFSLLFISITILNANSNYIKLKSDFDLQSTVNNISIKLKEKKFNVNQVLDFNRKTKVISFENPSNTKRIMYHDSKIALVMPYKILVYKNLDSEIIVYYKQFSYVKKDFDVNNCALIEHMSENIDSAVKSSIK